MCFSCPRLPSPRHRTPAVDLIFFWPFYSRCLNKATQRCLREARHHNCSSHASKPSRSKSVPTEPANSGTSLENCALSSGRPPRNESWPGEGDSNFKLQKGGFVGPEEVEKGPDLQGNHWGMGCQGRKTKCRR